LFVPGILLNRKAKTLPGLKTELFSFSRDAIFGYNGYNQLEE
jgi:hypothetical protein